MNAIRLSLLTAIVALGLFVSQAFAITGGQVDEDNTYSNVSPAKVGQLGVIWNYPTAAPVAGVPAVVDGVSTRAMRPCPCRRTP